jgi:hypothetical protein
MYGWKKSYLYQILSCDLFTGNENSFKYFLVCIKYQNGRVNVESFGTNCFEIGTKL